MPGSQTDANALIQATIGQEIREKQFEHGDKPSQERQADQQSSILYATAMILQRNAPQR